MHPLPELGQIDAQEVHEACLRDGDVTVSILSLGCITRDWRVGGVPVVLGYHDAVLYLDNPNYFGIIAGRCANRIAGGRFALNGQKVQLARNEGANHLHGGIRGLGARNWQIDMDGPRRLRLTCHSPDGEEGYPGTVKFTVQISLSGHRLSYDMRAAPDRPTPVNLAQHSYYNLAGTGTIWDHRLQIAAPAFTPADQGGIPTGQIASVAGTRFDFTAPRHMAQADPAQEGTDINLVLDMDRPTGAPAATVTAAGLRLRLWTDQPGLQLYNAMHLGPTAGGHDGQVYNRFSGLCLEPQHFPDTPNHPNFPPILCTPDAPYRQRLEVEIAPLSEAP